jgi:hypothetical protein
LVCHLIGPSLRRRVGKGATVAGGVAEEAVVGEARGGGRGAPRQLFWNLGRMPPGSDLSPASRFQGGDVSRMMGFDDDVGPLSMCTL